MTTRWDEAIREILELARAQAGGNAALANALRAAGVGPDSGPYSESAVSNWVKGRTRPPSDVILAVAAIANQSIDKYLDLDPTKDASKGSALKITGTKSAVPAEFKTLESHIIRLYDHLGLPHPNSEIISPPPAGLQESGDTQLDLVAVFPTRVDYQNTVLPKKRLPLAHSVDCAGLSLNVITQQLGDVQLREIIENGAVFRCLFLDPGSESMATRNREEGHPDGLLRSLTEINIAALAKVWQSLTPEAQPRLQLKTYDDTLRFNLTVVDQEEVVVQPYLPSARGLESPTFLIRQNRDIPHGLVHTFTEVFAGLWSHASDVIKHDE